MAAGNVSNRFNPSLTLGLPFLNNLFFRESLFVDCFLERHGISVVHGA